MTRGPTLHFILTYALDTQTVLVDELGTNADAAAATYTAREHAHADDPNIEVVLVGADSLETIKKTHSHYFTATTKELLVDLERELGLALDSVRG